MNFEHYSEVNLSKGSHSRQRLRERALLQQDSPMHRDNQPHQSLQEFTRSNKHVSTFSNIAYRQDICSANMTRNSRMNYRKNIGLHERQQQSSAYKSFKKRKLSGKDLSGVPFTISGDSDNYIDNKSCYNASQYSFQSQHQLHSHRRHRHPSPHSNCCYTDNEERGKVILKSITSINDADARNRSSICDNTLDDSRDHKGISLCSSQSKFIRRCSSVISFRQLLASASETDNDSKMNVTSMMPNDKDNKNCSLKNPIENTGKLQTGEILARLDMMRKNLAGNCLQKFGRHCIPLMRTLNTDNLYDNVLEASMGLTKNNNMKQPSFVKRLLLSKQLTNVKNGFYVSCMLQSAGKVLVTSHNMLPTVRVDLDNVSDLESHFYWLMKVTSDWSLMRNLKQVMKSELTSCKKLEPNIFHEKYAILRAVNVLQKITGIEKLGHLHTNIVKGTNYSVFMFINNDINAESKSSTPSLTSSPVSSSFLSTLKWMSLDKLSSSPVSNKQLKTNGVLNDLTSNCKELLTEFKNLNEQLKDGVYISYLYMTCHLQHGLQVLVSKDTPNNFPSIRMNDDHNSSSGTSTTNNCANILNELKSRNFEAIDDNFKSTMFSTMRQFDDVTFAQLPITPETSPASSPSSATQQTNRGTFDNGVALSNRLHRSIIPLNDQVKMILLAPPQSLFCPLINHTPVAPLPSSFFLPLRAFESIQLRTYQPQIFQKYCQVSVIMEMAVEIYRNRKAVLYAGSKHSQEEYTSELASVNLMLSELKKDMEETWKKYRWIGDLISQARLPVSENFISLHQFL
ncbi:hypothetical protein HELRODRAFT_182861 [Helobdella robusta]|uniref:Uncharacterized protein n=1 Tax=Helobdella robusta TaxID=6412 RepID=T1FIV9_HELRO|nr:hypothetical protein HELRODRAFT_182861 [Helobdella robusta]ESN90069.1 hypothetical protein HELRODRAFT_182861 [Helobdella robusta]